MDDDSGAVFFPGTPEYLWLDVPFVTRSAAGSYTAHASAPGPLIYQAQTLIDPGLTGRSATATTPLWSANPTVRATTERGATYTGAPCACVASTRSRAGATW